MARSFGTYGASHTRLGAWAYRAALPFTQALGASQQFYQRESAYAHERASTLHQKLRRGEPIYLLGIGPGGHSTGVALVEASLRGVRLICNNEEERYSGIKHETRYPTLGVEALRQQLAQLNIGTAQIHVCLASWDYVALPALYTRLLVEELPDSLTYLNPAADPLVMNLKHINQALHAPGQLGRQLGLNKPLPII